MSNPQLVPNKIFQPFAIKIFFNLKSFILPLMLLLENHSGKAGENMVSVHSLTRLDIILFLHPCLKE